MSHRTRRQLANGTHTAALAPMLLLIATASSASAQVNAGASWGTPTPTAPGGYYAGPAPTGYPNFTPVTTKTATDLEVGTLYAFSVGYGVGTGIWIDAEANIDDPALRFVTPAILGVAAPVGVFFLNRPTMPRGMPAAIATGMALGAGEGVGIATFQIANAQPGGEWGFRGFSRSVFLGSTIGTVGGFLAGYYVEPSPRQSLLLGSTAVWGTLIGSMIGGGATAAGSDWSHANDGTSLGGLIGYNVGLAGAAALSAVWLPSYDSLAWMWAGLGAGVVVSAPVYLFYINDTDHLRRGLIFQGVAGTLGLAAAAFFTIDSKDFGSRGSSQRIATSETQALPKAIQLTGGGLMPVNQGIGFQVQGLLF